MKINKYLISILLVISFIAFFMEPKASSIEGVMIGIDIKGAVNSPGYYELDSNSTVYDAIKASGGLKSYADTSIINLSKKLTDEDVIIIYTIDEVNEMKSGNTSIKIIEKTCVCPKIDNVACIGEVTIESKDKININTCTSDELMSLSGVGKSKAKAIMDYRELTPFSQIEDIMKVKGIGTGIFAKIKNDITV